MIAIRNWAAMCACGIVLATGAIAGETPTAATVLATVNNTEITLGHVIAMRSRLPEQYQNLPDDVLFQAIVDQLVQQTVLMQAISTEMDRVTAISQENEIRAFLAGEMIARITRAAISEEMLNAAYKERFESALPEQEYKASHILVKTREEAAQIVKQLQDGADFAGLAREKSTGPSGPGGGDLGWFAKGDMVKSFEDAVLALAIGDISQPIETQFGWHVIKLFDMRNGSIPTLEDVRENLTQELRQRALESEISRLTDGADVIRTEVEIDPAAIRNAALLNNE